jgi:hypothetical protein
MTDLPLSALLSQTLVAFTIEFSPIPMARAQLASPETLPHFPMVSHRGGFPDGS